MSCYLHYILWAVRTENTTRANKGSTLGGMLSSMLGQDVALLDARVFEAVFGSSWSRQLMVIMHQCLSIGSCTSAPSILLLNRVAIFQDISMHHEHMLLFFLAAVESEVRNWILDRMILCYNFWFYSLEAKYTSMEK